MSSIRCGDDVIDLQELQAECHRLMGECENMSDFCLYNCIFTAIDRYMKGESGFRVMDSMMIYENNDLRMAIDDLEMEVQDLSNRLAMAYGG